MNQAPPTPKGFRDIDPDLAKKRKETIGKIVPILEEFGFVPLETPTVEFASTLTGKYGEEERLIYKFTDRGDRELALRYDLTVPLARYVAANPSLKMPFRRYQIGQVFRGENPQAGRFREFTQFDFDTVGNEDLEEDAKIIAATINSAKSIGLSSAKMLINDRVNFKDMPQEVIRAFDKLVKIGMLGIEEELTGKGFDKDQITSFSNQITSAKPTKSIESIFTILKEKYNLPETDYQFDPSLARGLDYYTSSIFELKPNNDPTALSIGAGGRYDKLIGIFAGKQIPAVGFSFGLDRLVELVDHKF